MAHILVIEDDEPVRSTLKAMLESGGHVVTLAVNGDAGIQKFQQEPFDLVMCDVFMPQKEGLETIREIRQLSASVPIISMSGSFGAEPDIRAKGGPDFLRMARAFGATRTITKPFRMADLLALIRECLGAGDTEIS
jgi:CheY-like chemotaxis protein